MKENLLLITRGWALMRFVLYHMDRCVFCKHFRRMFKRDITNGEEVLLSGHEDPGWIEMGLNFVPTVIAYDDSGNEVSRLEAVRLVGIRKGPWADWLKEMGQ